MYLYTILYNFDWLFPLELLKLFVNFHMCRGQSEPPPDTPLKGDYETTDSR